MMVITYDPEDYLAWAMKNRHDGKAHYAALVADLAALRAERDELREALEAITERAEAVSDGIHVEKRNEGVSQAQHVRHMANHLAQHAKIARAVLAKYAGE